MNVNEQPCVETGATQCLLKFKEVYGAGNEAAYNGEGINFNLGCVSELGEIYGGAKAADLNKDAVLTITSGHFKKVFGGNNVSGKLNGKIVVNIDETGCNPVVIDELYGGGNLAAYSVYGYNDDGSVKESGTRLHEHPQVNIITIGTVFGGGNAAKVVGGTIVNIGTVATAKHVSGSDKTTEYNAGANIVGNVYGGGNQADVTGKTNVTVGRQ